VNEVGDSAVESGKKMSGGFDNAAKSASRLRSTMSKLFIPAAIFASVTRLIKLFTDLANRAEKTRDAMTGAFKDAERQAIEFRRQRMTGLQQDFARLNDELRNTEEEIRKVFVERADPTTFSGLVQTLFGTTKDYDEAIRRARAVYAELKRAAAEANRDSLASTRQRLDSEVLAVQAALAEIEAAELERQGKFEQAAQKRAEALSSAYITEMEAIRRAEREFLAIFGTEGEQFRFMREAMQNLHKLRIKQVQDEARIAAEAYQREMEDAIRRVQATIAGSLGGDFTNFGDAIAAAIDRNTTALQRRVRP